MKIVLACLMCLILTMSECFAIKGGPPVGKNVQTTGIYAGVLYPVDRNNSIGLFSVTVPKNGLGTGTVFLFANQNAYNGTMAATADPDSAVFTGFVDAGFNFVDPVCTANCSDPDASKHTITVLTVRAVASGRVVAKVKANTNVLSTARARLTGTSLLQFNPDFAVTGGITYNLVGFKQSDS